MIISLSSPNSSDSYIVFTMLIEADMLYICIEITKYPKHYIKDINNLYTRDIF